MAGPNRAEAFERDRQFHLDKRLKRYHSLHASSRAQASDAKQESKDCTKSEPTNLGAPRQIPDVPRPPSHVRTIMAKDDVYDRLTWRPQKQNTSKAKAAVTERRKPVVPRSLRVPDTKSNHTVSRDSAVSSQTSSEVPGCTQDVLQTAVAQLPDELAPPRWYSELRIPKSHHYDRTKLAELISVRTMITKCQSKQTSVDFGQLHANLRDQLHRVEFLTVDAILVKKSKLLDASYGLPQIFHERFLHDTSYPFDLQNDARFLFQKWRRADFDADLLRGIIINKKQKRSAARLDENYPNRISPNFIGAGDLLNGQWWPSQLCALRDGAHGSAQAGIHGHPKKGAYSIVIAGSHYDDKDDGDTILYCGTHGGVEAMSTSTQRMQESLILKSPVRVLRSHSLKSIYRPSEGLRFDGLYDVVASEVLDAVKNHHRFTLKRQGGQDPIRCGEPFQKPTTQELEAYHRQRDLFTTW